MSKRSSEIRRIEKRISRTNGYWVGREAVKPKLTKDDAMLIAKALKIDFEKELFTIDDFTLGINVELEHGTKYEETNVTKNDPILTGKIALAHLKEFPDYYIRLAKLEEEAKAHWEGKVVN